MKISLTDVTNITGQETSAIATINDNSETIEIAFDNTLSLDGTTPNSMLADFDMNGQDIINAGDIECDTITVAGVSATSQLFAVGPAGPTGPTGATGPAGAGTGDMLKANNLSDVISAATSFGNIKQVATTAATGVVELATQAETVAGTAGTLVPTAAIIKAIVDIICPVGTKGEFLMAAAPNGWLEMNGLTIGNATSGGTARANADTETLFTLIWTDTAVADLPIYTSAGVLATKGTSAANDFAANKRIALPNTQNIFSRAKYSGRALGSLQLEMIGTHTHPGATTDVAPNHQHTYSFTLESRAGGAAVGPHGAFSAGNDVIGNAVVGFFDDPAGSHAHTVTAPVNSGSENRPINMSFLWCIKY